MATIGLKDISVDTTWGDATRDINQNSRKIEAAFATVTAAGDGNASWGTETDESVVLNIGGSGSKTISKEGHGHETSDIEGLDAKLTENDNSIASLKNADTAIRGQIARVNTSISDLYNKVQDVDEGSVKPADLKTLTVSVNGTQVGEYDTKTDKNINITAEMLGLSGAMSFIGVTVSAISQGSTQNEIDLDDSTSYTAKTGDVVIYDKKEFVWVGTHWQELGDEQSFALKSVTVTGTGYLTGGGNLEANRTIDISSSVKTKIENGDAALTKANAIETNLANNYPTKNGTGASGTWGVDISGKAASADKVANALTFNSAGAGAASGSTYDGSGDKTISYNTVGAAKAVHSHAFSDITGKPTTLAEYGITDGASNAELSAHANNTDIHLEEGDRENIEAALVMASDVSSELAVILEGYDTTPTLSTELGKKADVGDLTAHTGDTSIHTTSAEKASWNGKYTKPEGGIPAEDLSDDVNASINSGSMSYELASEANGKVSLLLGSYGEEIPDLKNELGKKQDKLVSGTSIKTVNGESLLGRGNITTPKTTVVDNLTSTSGTDALSANQGKVLNEKFADVVTQADVVNSLGSTEQKKPLSAFMGKVLSDRLNNRDFIAKEAKMQWGGSNNSDANLSPVEAMLIERPSRTIFGNAEGVKVEYSTDGGSTWNAYTDNSNYGLLLRPYNETPFCLGGSSDRGKAVTDMLRITLNAKGIGVYLGNIRKIYFYGGQTNARSLKVVLESRKAIGGVSGGGDNEFEVVQTLDSFSAWPGWGFLSVNDNGFGTWSHSDTYNNNNIIEYRLTFSINVLYTTAYTAPYIARVGIYSTGIYESLEYSQMYGSPLVLHDDGYIHADRELNLTKRVQAQNIQVSNLNVLSSMTIKPSITVEGVLTVNSKIAGGGNIEASGQLIIDGKATLKSNLNVSEGIEVLGTYNHFAGEVDVDGDLHGANISAGSASIGSNLTVGNDVKISGKLDHTLVREATSEETVTLDWSKYLVITVGSSLTISLPEGYATDGKEYLCELRTGDVIPTISLPADIKFAYAMNVDTVIDANKVYQMSIQNGLAVICAFE